MTQLPGIETDALVRASFTVRRRVEGFTVVETPERRNYWFGNCLVLDRPPAPLSYERWLARHGEIFAGTGVQRRVVQWELPGARQVPPAPDRTDLDLDVSTVLVSEVTPEVAPRDDVTIRMLGEADWPRLDALERAESASAAPALADFNAWRTRMVERDAASGRAQLFGAFAGDVLLAHAGCYASQAWIRLTTPVTAAAHRRRGLFSSLFARAAAGARERFPHARIVVIAEADSAPERLYVSLGFGIVGYQYALVG